MYALEKSFSKLPLRINSIVVFFLQTVHEVSSKVMQHRCNTYMQKDIKFAGASVHKHI